VGFHSNPYQQEQLGRRQEGHRTSFFCLYPNAHHSHSHDAYPQEHYLTEYGKPIWVTEFACVDGQSPAIHLVYASLDCRKSHSYTDYEKFEPCTDQSEINSFIYDIVDYFENNSNVYAYAYSNGLGLGDVWPLMDGDSLRFVVLRFRRLHVKADGFDINLQTASRDRHTWMLSASITEYIQVYVSVDFTATSLDTFIATVIHHFPPGEKGTLAFP
jgi:hypothetical protein